MGLLDRRLALLRCCPRFDEVQILTLRRLRYGFFLGLLLPASLSRVICCWLLCRRIALLAQRSFLWHVSLPETIVFHLFFLLLEFSDIRELLSRPRILSRIYAFCKMILMFSADSL